MVEPKAMLACLALIVVGPTLVDYSIEQWKRRPEMQVEDAYKWLFHATMGGEHAIVSEIGPTAWMDREWATLTPPQDGEPEIEKLTPDGTLIRVNLRPYRARNADKATLLKAFIDSVRKFKGDKTTFLTAWNDLGTRLKTSQIQKMKAEDWKRVDVEMKADDYPAIHHSKPYEEQYKPAYRVISSDFWAITND